MIHVIMTRLKSFILLKDLMSSVCQTFSNANSLKLLTYILRWYLWFRDWDFTVTHDAKLKLIFHRLLHHQAKLRFFSALYKTTLGHGVREIHNATHLKSLYCLKPVDRDNKFHRKRCAWNTTSKFCVSEYLWHNSSAGEPCAID